MDSYPDDHPDCGPGQTAAFFGTNYLPGQGVYKHDKGAGLDEEEERSSVDSRSVLGLDDYRFEAALERPSRTS